MFIFDQPDGSARQLKSRVGHWLPPTQIRFYGGEVVATLGDGADGAALQILSSGKLLKKSMKIALSLLDVVSSVASSCCLFCCLLLFAVVCAMRISAILCIHARLMNASLREHDLNRHMDLSTSNCFTAVLLFLLLLVSSVVCFVVCFVVCC